MNDINVLTILHPELSEIEFYSVVDHLVSLGCHFTYTGFVDSIELGGKTLYSDISVSEVDVTDYDVFYMAGGWAAQIISNNENSTEAFTLIQNVFDAGLLLTSICGGAYIFAAADVINGTQIAGYSGHKKAIEAAGGIYVDENVVIDGQFVTAQAGSHRQLVLSIADVLGYYEETPPVFVNLVIEQLGDKQYNATVETADESPIQSVLIKIYEKLENEQKTLFKTVTLSETSTEYTFSGTISMTHDGIYSLDVSIIDCFDNDVIENEVAEIDTEKKMNKTNSPFTILLACIFCIAGVILARRRK
ncbi:MAG: DJ-1/PfpI family protein [Candidatus Heimdallarchaeota archaeon]|nr:DJ-1/PfpI family protein [Candidatus Heimdallarchaeota archaeon]